MSALSLCMIVRNAGPELPRALSSARGGYDELVIVDTGSRDGTQEIARRAGARVARFTAANAPDGTLLDFAAARNATIRLCRTPYWWFLDADEVCAPGMVARLRAHAEAHTTRPVSGVCVYGASRYFRPRLSPCRDEYRWVAACHEWLTTPTGVVRDAHLVVHHQPRPTRGDESSLRNLRILTGEIAAGRATVREIYGAARALHGLRRWSSAADLYRLVLARPDVPEFTAKFATLYLARMLRASHQFAASADVASHALARWPRFAEAACVLGDVASDCGHPDAVAAAAYERALSMGPCPLNDGFHEPHFYSDYPQRRLQALRGPATLTARLRA